MGRHGQRALTYDQAGSHPHELTPRTLRGVRDDTPPPRLALLWTLTPPRPPPGLGPPATRLFLWRLVLPPARIYHHHRAVLHIEIPVHLSPQRVQAQESTDAGLLHPGAERVVSGVGLAVVAKTPDPGEAAGAGATEHGLLPEGAVEVGDEGGGGGVWQFQSFVEPCGPQYAYSSFGAVRVRSLRECVVIRGSGRDPLPSHDSPSLPERVPMSERIWDAVLHHPRQLPCLLLHLVIEHGNRSSTMSPTRPLHGQTQGSGATACLLLLGGGQRVAHGRCLVYNPGDSRSAIW
jgi:hypothetical protein